MNNDSLYAAFVSKDARFDGRFFVGISTTGIYCRPICRAKQPRAANCTFFASAAEAEQSGYRPCLLCRPELAPGHSPMDATAALAHQAARLLESGWDDGLAPLAAHLGCTDRHLRRAFAATYHVSPVQYRQTCRLLLAKGLLTDTSLSVLDIAMASGFGSLRRFNDALQRQYRLTPTALRRRAPTSPDHDSPTLLLGYRPPYRWDALLAFLALRAIPGVEKIEDDTYLRTASIGGATGWLRVAHRPEKTALAVTISPSLLPVLPQVLARVRHLFDLCCDPVTVYEALSPMNDLRPGLCVPGTRLPGSFDGFEMAVRAVLGQQITVRAARTLAGRLAAAYGMSLVTGIDGLTHTFPTPDAILSLDGPIEAHLGPLGVLAARARTIEALARALAGGALTLSPCPDPQAQIDRLLAIRGIGGWTAHYIAMRTMAWPDAFLETDAGIKKALAPRGPREMLALAEAWRPWRSYATINLWNSLEQ